MHHQPHNQAETSQFPLSASQGINRRKSLMGNELLWKRNIQGHVQWCLQTKLYISPCVNWTKTGQGNWRSDSPQAYMMGAIIFLRIYVWYVSQLRSSICRFFLRQRSWWGAGIVSSGPCGHCGKGGEGSINVWKWLIIWRASEFCRWVQVSWAYKALRVKTCFVGSGMAGEALGTENAWRAQPGVMLGTLIQTSIGGLKVSSKTLMAGSLEIHLSCL